MKKKGQIVNFSSALSFVVALVVMGLLAAAGLIALQAFKSSYTTSAVFNTSLDNAATGIGNFTAQLPTVGTMIGIGLVLLIIVGVFAFGLMRRGGGGGL